MRVVAGRAVPEGQVEIVPRADRNAARLVPIADAAEVVREMVETKMAADSGRDRLMDGTRDRS